MNIDFLCRKNVTQGFIALNEKPYFYKSCQCEKNESECSECKNGLIQDDKKEIVADLSSGLPLSDDSVEVFLAADVLNTVDDFVFMMKEIHRVCKDNSLIIIKTPYAGSSYSYNPFAKRVFNIQTFLYFDDRSPFYKEENELPIFRILNQEFNMCNHIYLEMTSIKEEV